MSGSRFVSVHARHLIEPQYIVINRQELERDQEQGRAGRRRGAGSNFRSRTGICITPWNGGPATEQSHMGYFPILKFLLVCLRLLVNVTLNMKRLFTLIVLLAFTVGMIGCTPRDEAQPVDPVQTNDVPVAPAAPVEQ
jgi:hypothetical protein